MNWRKTAILALSLCLTGPAIADSKFYFGVNWGEGDLVNVGIEPSGIGFKFGREFGKFLAVEVHAASSALKSKYILRDPDVTVIGAFGRLNIPFKRVNIYALGGQSKVEYDSGTLSADDVENAFGFGVDLLASEDSMLTLESMTYNRDNALEFKVTNLGFTHRFDFWGFR